MFLYSEILDKRGEQHGNKEQSTASMLAKKKKTEGLTEAEQAEQKVLYRAYIDAFKANLRAQLENIEIIDDDTQEVEKRGGSGSTRGNTAGKREQAQLSAESVEKYPYIKQTFGTRK